MTIAVDCRMPEASGVGVYLRGILPRLLQSEHSFLLLGNAGQLQSFAGNPNVKIIKCCTKPFSLKELFCFPSKIKRQINSACLYFSPFLNIPGGIKIPVYTTIHDIIFPDMPELTSRTGLAVRMWFYRRAYAKSKKIFTVSEFSKSRIKHHLGKAKPVIVTYSAVQTMFFEYKTKVPGIQKKETIVFAGNIKKHKGLDCLLEAFLLAGAEGPVHKLVIIGSKENLRTGNDAILQKIDSLDPETVLFTGFLSDEQLMEYITQASLLIQPSLYEGFGLPPLEAMVLGTRVLISDIPVFKEIYDGFPVTFFRAGDSKDLKEKMLKLLLEKPAETVSLAKNLLEKYTFEKTASIIMKELE